ncbi:hypothetical protein ABG79_00164 [Caloramator mitchellensis]|uniref:YkuS family protein n=1 Tax=Caloramator mitchellensis TaxID=908809 RepID=A0A0R3K6F6_CALMK|nr:YkuS family protein [Caloramator mitchellensis]KRQ87999.1 hypothetical protein ABG79_00164 [Caloramator mitchellensis]
MRRKIAVERSLQNVRQLFESQGYKVDMFDDTQLHEIKSSTQYDAIIISGGNRDFLGIHETETNTPVIDASGLSAQSILDRVTRLEF